MKALVTGASSGIGRDMARYLASLGYTVYAVGRDERKLSDLKNELGEKIQVIIKDLSVKENAISLYEELKMENIDLVVNNAGFGVFGEFADTDLEREISLINTNITAVHILTKLFLKDMLRENKGKILNVASIAGFAPGPLMGAYYASKAYVLRLTESVYEELKKKKSDVTISALCPGPVDTNFNNVANVKFSIKALPSEYVAKYGIDKALKGKLIIVPGIIPKLCRFFSKITPDKLSMKVVYANQTKKVNK
jgi:short-subunit dehydrogenase